MSSSDPQSPIDSQADAGLALPTDEPILNNNDDLPIIEDRPEEMSEKKPKKERPDDGGFGHGFRRKTNDASGFIRKTEDDKQADVDDFLASQGIVRPDQAIERNPGKYVGLQSVAMARRANGILTPSEARQ